jgi:hypothetical protein
MQSDVAKRFSSAHFAKLVVEQVLAHFQFPNAK